MSATNLHIFVMVVPLLSALAVNLMGRCFRQWIAPLVLGSLTFSVFGSVIMLARVIEHGKLSYTVGNWRPPFGIELVVDPLSALMMVLIAVVALLASFSSLKSVEQELPGREHFFFVLFQFGSDKSFRVFQCLFADEIRGDLVAMSIGDFDVVAKDFVEAHFQIGNTGLLHGIGLILGDPLLATSGQLAQRVQL